MPQIGPQGMVGPTAIIPLLARDGIWVLVDITLGALAPNYAMSWTWRNLGQYT